MKQLTNQMCRERGLTVAEKLGTGKKVLALAPDNGERYLSTALYEFEV